jgi:hypothetical protein
MPAPLAWTPSRLLPPREEAGHVGAGLFQGLTPALLNRAQQGAVVGVLRIGKNRDRFAVGGALEAAAAGGLGQVRRERGAELRVGEIDPGRAPVPARDQARAGELAMARDAVRERDTAPVRIGVDENRE